MVVRGTHRPHEDGSFMGWGRVLHIVRVKRRVSIFTQRAGELVLVTTTPYYAKVPDHGVRYSSFDITCIGFPFPFLIPKNISFHL